MTLPEAIATLLNANAALTNVVPSSSIVPVDALQDAPNPCIVFEFVNTLPEDDKGGSTIEETQLEIDIFSTSYLTAHEILDLTRSALDRQSGDYGSFKIDNIVFEGYQDHAKNNDTGTYQVSSGFIVRVKRD